MAKDLASANKPAKKAPKKKLVSTVTKAKKAALTMPSQQKVSTQLRGGAYKLVKSIVVAEIEGVVTLVIMGGKTSTRTINLP